MLTYHDMKLVAYKSRYGNGIAIECRKPGHMDNPMNYISFYMDGADFIGLMDGTRDAASDLRHKLWRSGDLFTFYDFDFPLKAYGKVEVPFVTITIPFHVRRILARAAHMAWAKCRVDDNRITLDIPWKLRQRWDNRYGEAKGRVVMDCDSVVDKLAKVGYNHKFEEMINRLRQIALNTTRRDSDTATVRLSNDMAGFFFNILDPKGRSALHGGLINHGTDENPDWSIHT